MAAYTDARQKMNDMRLARGFYPVVAMVPPPTRSTAPIIPSRASAAGRGRGAARGTSRGGAAGRATASKGRGKTNFASGYGKGAAVRGPPHSPPRATEETICLRCG
eukprot:588465-Pyramimonas_sp.AAC.1